MVHELDRLLPAFVFEEDDGPGTLLFEIEAYLCADPFFGAVDHLPKHVLGGMKLENLHVEAAAVKAELEHSADFAFPLYVVRPPAAKTFARGQCLMCVAIAFLLRLVFFVVRTVLDTTCLLVVID